MAFLTLLRLSLFSFLAAEDVDSPNRRTGDLRVAVCAVGHLRAFTLPGMCKSWLKNLVSGVTADIYLVAHSGHYQGSAVAVGRFKDELYKHGLDCLKASAPIVYANLCEGHCADLEAAWKADGVKRRRCMGHDGNFMQILWIDHCMHKVRSSGNKYDLIVRTRPDVGVLAPMPWKLMSSSHVNYMNKDCNGKADWFFVIGPRVLKSWWDGVVNLYLTAGGGMVPDYTIFARPNTPLRYVEFPVVILRGESCKQKGCHVGVGDSQCFRLVGSKSPGSCSWPHPISKLQEKMMSPYYAICMKYAMSGYWYSDKISKTSIDTVKSQSPASSVDGERLEAQIHRTGKGATTMKIATTVTMLTTTSTHTAVASTSPVSVLSSREEVSEASKNISRDTVSDARSDSLRVAVCSVGHLRSFALPGMCESLVQNLVAGVEADFYLVAHTGIFHGSQFLLSQFDEKLSKRGIDCLRAHRPVHVHICAGDCAALEAVWKSDGYPDRKCLGHDSNFMQIMWLDHCIHQVRYSGKRYDLLVRTRPDVSVFSPMPWNSIAKDRLNYMYTDCDDVADWFFALGMPLVETWWDPTVKLYVSGAPGLSLSQSLNAPHYKNILDLPVVILGDLSCRGKGCHIGVHDAQCFRLVGESSRRICPLPQPVPESLVSTMSPYYRECMEKASSGYWYVLQNTTSTTTPLALLVYEGGLGAYALLRYLQRLDLLVIIVGLCLAVCFALVRRGRCCSRSEVAAVPASLDHENGVNQSIGKARVKFDILAL